MLNGVTGIDAEPAQAAVIAAGLSGRAVCRLDALSVRRLRGLAGQVVMGSREPGKVIDPPPWFISSGLPAGDYDVRLHLADPRAGTVTVGIGDNRIERNVTAAVDQSWPIRVENIGRK